MTFFFYSGQFCLHPSHCRDAFGELLKTRVFSKGDCVGKRSSGVRSMSDIYFRCNGCLKLGEDFFFNLKNRVFGHFVLSFAKLVIFYPPLTGEGTPPPLAKFLNNLKMITDIDAKLTVPYTVYIWHIQTKFQRNLSDFFLENGVLVTSDHTKKNSQLSMASRM